MQKSISSIFLLILVICTGNNLVFATDNPLINGQPVKHIATPNNETLYTIQNTQATDLISILHDADSTEKYRIIDISIPLENIDLHTDSLSNKQKPIRKISLIIRSNISDQQLLQKLEGIKKQHEIIIESHAVDTNWLINNALKGAIQVSQMTMAFDPTNMKQPKDRKTKLSITFLLKPVEVALKPLIFLVEKAFPKNNTYGYVEPNQFMRTAGGIMASVAFILAVFTNWTGMMHPQSFNLIDFTQLTSQSSNMGLMSSGHNIHLFLLATMVQFYLYYFHEIWGKTWLNILNRVKLLGIPQFFSDLTLNLFKSNDGNVSLHNRKPINPKLGELHQLIFNFGYTAFWLVLFRTLAHSAHPLEVPSVLTSSFLQDFLFLSMGQSFFTSIGFSGLNNLYKKGHYSQNGKFIRLLILDLFMIINGLLLAYGSDWLYMTAPMEWSLKLALAIFGSKLPALKHLFLVDRFLIHKGVDVSGNLPFQLKLLHQCE